VTFSPDQRDEFLLGIDEAFLLPPPFLMGRLPHMRRRRWARLHRFPLSELDHIGDELSRRLPPFKFNLFVQYKRPEYLSRSSAVEWPAGNSRIFNMRRYHIGRICSQGSSGNHLVAHRRFTRHWRSGAAKIYIRAW
jgi:hypothetical protein